MPTGFESIGDSGSYQIDSSFVNLALVRAGTLVSQSYTSGEITSTTPTRVQLTLQDGEILALACTAYCALGSKVGTTAYVYVNAPEGQLVEYYVFRPGTTRSTLGLQVFDENKVITFDSGWKLFDVRRILSGLGTFSLPTNKKYAVVHTRIATSVVYQRVVVGISPNYTSNYFRRTSFSAYRINSGTIACALTVVDIAGTRPTPSPSSNGYMETYANGATALALAIDVTGYL